MRGRHGTGIGGFYMKKISVGFGALAILLSDIMCAVVSYNYCAMQWCGRYAGCSAPPSIAFLLAIPYAIGIAVCVALAVVFRKKSKISRTEERAGEN